MKKIRRIDKVFRMIGVVVLFASVCLLVKACVDRVQAKKAADELVETVYIVYTDEQGSARVKVTDPWEGFEHANKVEPAFVLDASERQRVAEIVAGQCAGKTVTCQMMVANVFYNQIHANGDKIDGTDYAKCGRQTPSEETYKAVDAIFTRGEWLLDDTVLWTGDAENPDAWHQTLRLVTTCDGIAFYEVNT
ncbi:MAG: hypothetical protein IKD54_08330 [Clostridia bacterium]|nr:hypothetical protein [Clostridia bacterium]